MVDLLMDGETLFKREEVFDPNHLPETFVHREKQLKQLARSIRPVLRGSRGVNTILYGPPATGKTTAIRTVFSQLEEETSSVKPVHINCQIYSTTFSVFSKIYEQLFGIQAPETGTAFSTLYDKIKKKIGDGGLIVALDDIYYLNTKEMNKLLYNLLRMHEVSEAKVCVWAVVPDPDKITLDQKVSSTFSPQKVEFPTYNKVEILDILKNRAEYGFYSGVISQQLLEKIANLTHKYGDLRTGIEALKRAALAAEEDESKKIQEKHLEGIFQLDKDPILEKLEKEKTSGQLYKQLKDQMSYSSFYRAIEQLEQENKIETKFVRKGKGRTRIISKK